VPEFFLIPYFSIVRQSLAFLAILFAFTKAYKNKFSYVVLIIVASSIHYSAFFYWFLIESFSLLKPRKASLIVLAALGSLSFLLDLNYLQLLANLAPASFLQKLLIYIQLDSYSLPLHYRIFYALLFFVIVYIFSSRLTLFLDHAKNKNYAPSFAYLTVVPFIFCLFFPDFPTFTSRFLTLGSIPISLAVASFFNSSMDQIRRFYFLAPSLIMTAPLIYLLSSPLFIVYRPYQSLLFVDERSSTGMSRTKKLYSQLYLK